jgi:hypothetical protein
MVEGTIDSVHFETPLEPDGRWSHWFRPDTSLLKAARANVGDTVTLEITPMKVWPEPEVPADWQHITTMARWEWIRWVRATNNSETRARRIAVGISKMRSGKRRPCCWNCNLCTEPEVSKNGVLLEPAPTR